MYTVRVDKGSTSKAWMVDHIDDAIDIFVTYARKGFRADIISDGGVIVRKTY